MVQTTPSPGSTVECRPGPLPSRLGASADAVLLAGVAHDLRNVLTGIGLLSETLLTALAPGPNRAQAEELARAARCAEDLLHQLLSLARPQTSEIRSLSLNALLAGMSVLLQQIAGKGIVLEVRRGSLVPNVRISPAEIYEVVLNLVFNARDAMPNGGRLTIETAAERLNAAGARDWGVAAGNYVRLLVRDTGCGMDAETSARAFEPFFTTKPGTGTGLGLPMCRRVIARNSGAMALESAPGQGTTVTLLLPAAKSEGRQVRGHSSAVRQR